MFNLDDDDSTELDELEARLNELAELLLAQGLDNGRLIVDGIAIEFTVLR